MSDSSTTPVTLRVLPGLMVPTLFTAIAGAIAFDAAQRLEGLSPTIPEFMGQAIVRQGGYAAGLEGMIGWGVHLGVALAYTMIFAATAWALFGATDRLKRWIGAALLAALLAIVSTVITTPAIAITISVMAGNGFPDALPGLNTSWGWPGWNHLLFFAIAWLGTVVVPDRL